jgi:hypothetical protein
LIEIAINKNSYALRPTLRIPSKDKLKQDQVVVYEARTFPVDPYDGVQMHLLKLIALGYCNGIEEQEPLPGKQAVNVLDKKGAVLHTFSITRKGLHYLQRILKLHVKSE